jgi:hypothetical protein
LDFRAVIPTGQPATAATVHGFAVTKLDPMELLNETLADSSDEGSVALVDLLQLAPATEPALLGVAFQLGRLVFGRSHAVTWRNFRAGSGAADLCVWPGLRCGRDAGSGFLAAHPARDGWLVAAWRSPITLVMALLVAVMRNRQEFLEQEVATRTETLSATVERLQMLWQALEQSPASVVITDAAKQIESTSIPR